jgi:hypothetical protein
LPKRPAALNPVGWAWLPRRHGVSGRRYPSADPGRCTAARVGGLLARRSAFVLTITEPSRSVPCQAIRGGVCPLSCSASDHGAGRAGWPAI